MLYLCSEGLSASLSTSIASLPLRREPSLNAHSAQVAYVCFRLIQTYALDGGNFWEQGLYMWGLYMGDRMNLPTQAAVMAAQSRYQEAHTTLDRSVAAEQRMQTDLIQLRSSVEQASRECRYVDSSSGFRAGKDIFYLQEILLHMKALRLG